MAESGQQDDSKQVSSLAPAFISASILEIKTIRMRHVERLMGCATATCVHLFSLARRVVLTAYDSLSCPLPVGRGYVGWQPCAHMGLAPPCTGRLLLSLRCGGRRGARALALPSTHEVVVPFVQEYERGEGSRDHRMLCSMGWVPGTPLKEGGSAPPLACRPTKGFAPRVVLTSDSKERQRRSPHVLY